MTSILIRDACDADAPALARLCTQLGYPAEPAAIPGRLERLARDGDVRVLVAVIGEDVVGAETAHLRFTLNHQMPIAQITMLVVDQSIRTRGVGRALVEAAERWARDRGCHRVVVTTALHRADAHAFYERLGYAHTGRRYGKDFPLQSELE